MWVDLVINVGVSIETTQNVNTGIMRRDRPDIEISFNLGIEVERCSTHDKDV